MTRTALSIPAVLALLLCTSAARADDDERDYPHITAASPQGADLVIDGDSFGVRAVPRVFLADQQLKVSSFSESTIVAELPASVPFGSYELRVQTFFSHGRGREHHEVWAAFDVAIVGAGTQGPQGAAGTAGPQGPAGPAGPQGSVGPAGPAGPVGPQGSAGPAGSQGPAGPAGSTGPMGPAGPAGPAGAQGGVGPMGLPGPQGPAGAQGPAGPQGPAGATGATGAAGPAGPAGPQGAVGPAGPGTPSGAVGFFNLPACPDGWTEFAPAQGRAVVAIGSLGTLGAQVGTALADQENRFHTHVTPTHMHSYSASFTTQQAALAPSELGAAGAAGYTGGYFGENDATGSLTRGGQHTHSATLSGFTGGSGALRTSAAYTGDVMPYIQLLACQKN